MTAAAEEKEKGATKIHIYHTNKGRSSAPERSLWNRRGCYFRKHQQKRRKHHKPSILQDKNHTCYLCILLNGDHHKHRTLHEHHIFGGPNRIHSEEEGLKVYLCPEHHLTGPAAVHRCQETQNILHQIGQQEFEKTHTREEFRKIFGRSYL